MARRKVLVKLSGYLYPLVNRKVVEFLKELSRKYHVVLILGAGGKIMEALMENGYERSAQNGSLEKGCLKHVQVGRDVAEFCAAELKDLLAENCIDAEVVIPFQVWGSVLCHHPGDDMLKFLAPNFSEVFELTTKERHAEKIDAFQGFKIEVVSF